MTFKQTFSSRSIFTRVAFVLVILFAIFISLFALDVFTTGTPFWQILVALFMHLIPTFIILLILWAAWKYPFIGGPLFILAGLGYIFTARNQVFLTYVLIAGIPMSIGSLFLAGYLQEKRRAS